MTKRKSVWRAILTRAAERDFDAVVAWSRQHFGPTQATAYTELLLSAIGRLKSGPSTLGIRNRPELGQDVMTLHIARRGKSARHILVFQIAVGTKVPTLEILRILHDAMDLPQHALKRGERGGKT